MGRDNTPQISKDVTRRLIPSIENKYLEMGIRGIAHPFKKPIARPVPSEAEIKNCSVMRLALISSNCGAIPDACSQVSVCERLTSLLMTDLCIEIQPYDIADFGSITIHHQGSSLPTAGPKLTSVCRFSGVIPASSPWRSYSSGYTGSIRSKGDGHGKRRAK
ncbi:MAG: hypothetical protein BECKG1743F_GA0114225_105703 [Candidatus Kentron sp. G]|nr:MAG: hypothetical protein BECKG1743E_GA0114224_101873 [Candidatus Kentron sp. G]VFN01339.1 MAG: hypothetical protein BECKG1743F_GA0114225_105703 [Candidatus Kentron sp. G]